MDFLSYSPYVGFMDYVQADDLSGKREVSPAA
jgi:hypothetical protein